MSAMTEPREWSVPSGDPNDEGFGDLVEPVSSLDRNALEEYAAILVGEPFDEAVIGRRGASEGPGAIRSALESVKSHHFDAGPIGAHGSIGDAGDVAVADGASSVDHRVRDLQAAVRSAVEPLHAAPTLPVFLGGDNSLTYPNASPLLDSGSLGVVNLDAHLDVREMRDEPTSGTPYRQLFDAGLDAYACVGARHFETSRAYHDFVRDRDGEVITAEEVGSDPVAAVERALAAMDDVDRVYVSVDCDVVDASAAPGVSAPTPGGITTRELFRLLRMLAGDERIAGFEVVECAPPLDRNGRTSDAAARAVAHFLAGYLEANE